MTETLLRTHSKWILILVCYGTFYTILYDELIYDINGGVVTFRLGMMQQTQHLV